MSNLDSRLAEINESLNNQLNEAQEELEAKEAELQKYRELGDADEVKQAIDDASDTIDELNESFNRTARTVRKIYESAEQVGIETTDPETGTEREVEDVLDELVAKSEDGTEAKRELEQVGDELQSVTGTESTEDAIQEVRKMRKVLESLGVADDLDKAEEVANEYGTLGEMTDALDSASDRLGEIADKAKDEEVAAVADKYGKDKEEVERVMERYNMDHPSEYVDLMESLGIKPDSFQRINESRQMESIVESVRPGSALNTIITGKAFSKSAINESVRPNVGIVESFNDTSRQGSLMASILAK